MQQNTGQGHSDLRYHLSEQAAAQAWQTSRLKHRTCRESRETAEEAAVSSPRLPVKPELGEGGMFSSHDQEHRRQRKAPCFINVQGKSDERRSDFASLEAQCPS